MLIWLFLSILCVAAVIGISVWRSVHSTSVERLLVRAKRDGASESDLAAMREAEAFPLPGFVRTALILAALAFLCVSCFHKVFFYAEPGYVYHVRTILGEERVVDDVGYSYYLFGRYNAWKKAMTVQCADVKALPKQRSNLNAETETSGGITSATLPPYRVVLLDRVDMQISATARFRIPTDEVPS